MSTHGARSSQTLADAVERLGAWFPLLARHVPAGVVVLDAEGRPVFANEVALELLGVDGPTGTAERLGELNERLPRDLAAQGELVRLAPPAGGARDVLARSIPVPGDGALVLLEDGAKRSALSASLALASRMRALGVLRSQAHDLKAPLNSIALNLQVLRNELEADEDVAPEARASRLATADLLRREIARMGRALDAFLHRAMDRPSPDRAARFELRRLVRDLAKLVRPTAKEAGVRIRTLLPDEPVHALASRDRVHQALLNVVLNAVEAQEVLDRRGEVRLQVEREDGRAVVRVEDEGPGIPEPLLRKVFEMNFTTKADGTGIGLTVARSLIEAQRGGLEVESRPGAGTTVTVHLPSEPD